MDADDVALPERFARQVARLDAEPALDVLGCRVSLLDGGGDGNAGMRAYVEWSNTLLDPRGDRAPTCSWSRRSRIRR